MLIFARYHPYTYEQFLDYGKGLYAVRELSFTCLFFFFFCKPEIRGSGFV